jgi:hypothetical protein
MAILANYFIYSALFTSQMGIKVSLIPDTSATIQAVLVGILIPLLGSIVPI